jgi:hypothetical protein
MPEGHTTQFTIACEKDDRKTFDEWLKSSGVLSRNASFHYICEAIRNDRLIILDAPLASLLFDYFLVRSRKVAEKAATDTVLHILWSEGFIASPDDRGEYK